MAQIAQNEKNMIMKFSDNLDGIKQSGTLKFYNILRKKINSGEDITPLVAGELHNSTPEHIARAGIDAIKEGKTKYTISTGIVELREAICQKLKIENELNYNPDEIMVTSGAKQAIFNSVFATCGAGDEVIIFAPYFTSYPEIIKLAKATPKVVELCESNEYQIEYDYLKKHITDKTRLIIINSPNNPTGSVLSKESLIAVAKICYENKIWLLTDEIYEKIVYEPYVHYSPSQVFPDIKDFTIVVNGFSKTYAMTGWRIGYMAAPAELVKKVNVIQSHTTSNASTIAQYAALKALESGDDFMKSILPELYKNKQIINETLTSSNIADYFDPRGSFYLFLSIEQFLGKKYGEKVISDSSDMAFYLLETGKVGVVPGVAFGANDHIRISFSRTYDIVKTGIEKVKDCLLKLK